MTLKLLKLTNQLFNSAVNRIGFLPAAFISSLITLIPHSIFIGSMLFIFELQATVIPIMAFTAITAAYFLNIIFMTYQNSYVFQHKLYVSANGHKKFVAVKLLAIAINIAITYAYISTVKDIPIVETSIFKAMVFFPQLLVDGLLGLLGGDYKAFVLSAAVFIAIALLFKHIGLLASRIEQANLDLLVYGDDDEFDFDKEFNDNEV